jgi:hypothetical protein
MLVVLGDAAAERRVFPRRLVVPNGSKDSFVNVDEIEWIEAASGHPTRRLSETAYTAHPSD